MPLLDGSMPAPGFNNPLSAAQQHPATGAAGAAHQHPIVSEHTQAAVEHSQRAPYAGEDDESVYAALDTGTPLSCAPSGESVATQ